MNNYYVGVICALMVDFAMINNMYTSFIMYHYIITYACTVVNGASWC